MIDAKARDVMNPKILTVSEEMTVRELEMIVQLLVAQK